MHLNKYERLAKKKVIKSEQESNFYLPISGRIFSINFELCVALRIGKRLDLKRPVSVIQETLSINMTSDVC